VTVAGSGGGPYTVSGCHAFATVVGSASEVEARFHYTNGRSGDWSRQGHIVPLLGHVVTVTVHDDGGAEGRTTSLVQLGAPLTITGAIGDLKVKSGDIVRAGYDFSIDGRHPARQEVFFDAKVSLTIVCPDGATQVLTIAMQPNPAFYDDPLDYKPWIPSDRPDSSLVFQGQGTVPPGTCGGAAGHVKGKTGAVFTTNVGQV